MYRTFSTLVLFLVIQCAVHAGQSIYLKVLSNTPDTVRHKYYLQSYRGDAYYTRDSAMATDNTEIIFHVNELSVRMYKIISPGSDLKDIEFIISAKESEVRMSATREEFNKRQYNFFGSTENYCLQSVINAQKEFEERSKSLLTAKFNIDNFDPDLLRKREWYDSLFQTSILHVDNELKAIGEKFEHTYCSSVIIHNSLLPSRYLNEKWKAEFDNDNGFLHQHYFEFLDLRDSLVLNFPFFRSMLDTYLKTYTHHSAAGQKYFVDLIFSKPMCADVRHFLTGLYTQSFAMSNNEELVRYMLSKQSDVCESDSSPSLIKSLALLQPGSAAPDISLPDINGHLQRLSEIAPKKPLTVLVFYSPTCPHCMDLLRELDQFYKMNQQSMNVFTVTSAPAAEASEFCKSKKYEWTNTVFDQKDKSESNAYNRYAVIGTPAMILIDDKMKIITRFGDMQRVRELVSK